MNVKDRKTCVLDDKVLNCGAKHCESLCEERERQYRNKYPRNKTHHKRIAICVLLGPDFLYGLEVDGEVHRLAHGTPVAFKDKPAARAYAREHADELLAGVKT